MQEVFFEFGKLVILSGTYCRVGHRHERRVQPYVSPLFIVVLAGETCLLIALCFDGGSLVIYHFSERAKYGKLLLGLGNGVAGGS